MNLSDIDTIALADHGLVTRESSGLGRSAWYRAIRSGTLIAVHPGVARLVGTPATYRQRTAAAVLAMAASTASSRARGSWTPGRAMASHRSAAALWLDRGPARAIVDRETPVDVITTRRTRSPTFAGVVVHRPTDLGRLTPQLVDGIRCTNILRTLLDLGAVDPAAVHRLLGHALSTKMVDLDAVETALIEHSRPGRTGVVALRSALDEWAIDARPADSVLEPAFVRLVARFGLPPVEFHPIVEGWEVDFRFVGTRLIVECDGWTTHGLDRIRFERDRRRDAELQAAGWIVSRHTYRAITNDAARTAHRIRALLSHAA